MPGGVSRAAFACGAFGRDGVLLLRRSLARWLLESVLAMLLLILRLRCMAVLFRSVLPLRRALLLRRGDRTAVWRMVLFPVGERSQL